MNLPNRRPRGISIRFEPEKNLIAMNFRFQNLLGAPYRGGNAVVTADGVLLSPVGNRVSATDLLKSQSQTLSFEASANISRIAVTPDGSFLLAVDSNSRALFVNLSRHVVLHRIKFKLPVTALRFSPDGEHIAVGLKKLIQIWRSPGFRKEFFPFELERTYSDFAGTVTTLEWSPDSKYLLAGSKDLTVRLFYLKESRRTNKPYLFLGHRDNIVGAFFSTDKISGTVVRVYTISRNGGLFTWKLVENYDFDARKEPDSEPPSPGTPEQKSSERDQAEESMDIDDNKRKRKKKGGDDDSEKSKILLHRARWELVKKDYFMQAPAKVAACDYHRDLDMVVVGYSNGVFGLYQMPDFVCIHLLSISREKITTAVFNKLGNWLTFGCAKLGQLLVWEWRSESYILKQQGHYFDVNCIAYSPDSQMIATGADDNKVKVKQYNLTKEFYVRHHLTHCVQYQLLVYSKSLALCLTNIEKQKNLSDSFVHMLFKIYNPVNNLKIYPSESLFNYCL